MNNRIVTTKGNHKIIVTLYGENNKERFNHEYALARIRAEMLDGYDRYLSNRRAAIAEQERKEAAMNMQMIAKGIFVEAEDIFEEYENE